MIFKSLTLEDVEKVRKWREGNIKALRTPFDLTKEQQEQFYKDVVCNRLARSRYWAVSKNDILIAMVGLDNIEWENGIAEISIVVDPSERGKNWGEQIVDELLRKAFDEMRLLNVYGECYACNPAIDFWKKIINKYSSFSVTLPHRKYYNFKIWHSLYFSINTNNYTDTHNEPQDNKSKEE